MITGLKVSLPGELGKQGHPWKYDYAKATQEVTVTVDDIPAKMRMRELWQQITITIQTKDGYYDETAIGDVSRLASHGEVTLRAAVARNGGIPKPLRDKP